MSPLKQLAVLSLLATTHTALAAEKHVHGEGELFIAIENNKVLIELESAAYNILGFEHKPKNADQEKHVERASTLLASYSSIITLEEASCKQVAANIAAPFDDHSKHDEEHDHNEHGHDKHHEEEHNHDEHDHDKHHEEEHNHSEHDHDAHHEEEHHHEHDHDKHDHGEHDEEGHSDYHVSYTLQCAEIKSPLSVKVTAFDHFSEFKSIDVNWVSDKGQGSQKTTTKSPKVKFSL